jgi:hypothetical protein
LGDTWEDTWEEIGTADGSAGRTSWWSLVDLNDKIETYTKI